MLTAAACDQASVQSLCAGYLAMAGGLSGLAALISDPLQNWFNHS